MQALHDAEFHFLELLNPMKPSLDTILLIRTVKRLKTGILTNVDSTRKISLSLAVLLRVRGCAIVNACIFDFYRKIEPVFPLFMGCGWHSKLEENIGLQIGNKTLHSSFSSIRMYRVDTDIQPVCAHTN